MELILDSSICTLTTHDKLNYYCHMSACALSNHFKLMPDSHPSDGTLIIHTRVNAVFSYCSLSIRYITHA